MTHTRVLPYCRSMRAPYQLCCLNAHYFAHCLPARLFATFYRLRHAHACCRLPAAGTITPCRIPMPTPAPPLIPAAWRVSGFLRLPPAAFVPAGFCFTVAAFRHTTTTTTSLPHTHYLDGRSCYLPTTTTATYHACTVYTQHYHHCSAPLIRHLYNHHYHHHHTTTTSPATPSPRRYSTAATHGTFKHRTPPAAYRIILVLYTTYHLHCWVQPPACMHCTPPSLRRLTSALQRKEIALNYRYRIRAKLHRTCRRRMRTTVHCCAFILVYALLPPYRHRPVRTPLPACCIHYHAPAYPCTVPILPLLLDYRSIHLPPYLPPPIRHRLLPSHTCTTARVCIAGCHCSTLPYPRPTAATDVPPRGPVRGCAVLLPTCTCLRFTTWITATAHTKRHLLHQHTCRTFTAFWTYTAVRIYRLPVPTCLHHMLPPTHYLPLGHGLFWTGFICLLLPCYLQYHFCTAMPDIVH